MEGSGTAGDEELEGLRYVVRYSMEQQQRESGRKELNQGLCKSPIYSLVLDVTLTRVTMPVLEPRESVLKYLSNEISDSEKEKD